MKRLLSLFLLISVSPLMAFNSETLNWGQKKITESLSAISNSEVIGQMHNWAQKKIGDSEFLTVVSRDAHALGNLCKSAVLNINDKIAKEKETILFFGALIIGYSYLFEHAVKTAKKRDYLTPGESRASKALFAAGCLISGISLANIV